MSLPRVALVVVAGLSFADYKFGNARLIQWMSAHTTQMVYTLNDHVSTFARRVSP
jgi:hypothetical protein